MTSLRGICLVSPGGWKRQGGIEAHARSIATSLDSYQPGIFTEILDSRGDRHLAFAPFYLLWASLRLIGLRMMNRIDVVHVQVSERGSFVRKATVVWLAKRLGLRVVLHHHGAEAIETFGSASKRLQRLVDYLTNAADVNVVLGSAWADWLTDDLKVPAERVEVVYNGIPDLDTDPLPIPSGEVFKPVLIAVLSDRKGVGDFLHSLAKLRERDISFSATVAGGGPHLARFQALAVELGIADACSFPGWVTPNDVPDMLEKHDCYVLPSYKEGLPIGILEALRAARPVITTDVGSISEAIPAGRGVSILEPGDIEGLADELACLAKSRADISERGKAARALFEEKFTLDRHITKLLSLYQPSLRTESGSDKSAPANSPSTVSSS